MKKLKTYTTYQASLDAERDRERKWRKTKQGAFESEMTSFEETKGAFHSLGAAIQRMPAAERKEALRQYKTAHERVRRHAPECLEVFLLILKNGKEQSKSIWEMVNRIKKQSGVLKKTALFEAQRKLYRRHRERLLELFGVEDDDKKASEEEEEKSTE